jgi:RNA polymerase sigma-70 factor (ECF subfamily)
VDVELTADLDALRALARSLVHGDPDAEDLVQDAALAALEHPPATDRPVRPWLSTVLRNRWRMLYRGATRRAAREDAVAECDAAPPADDLLERARTLERLGAALVALEEPFREIVIRRYLDGETSAQIARALGVPAGTVRWRLKTGLDRLRATLDEGSSRRRWQLALVTGVSVKTHSSSLLVVLVLLLIAAAVAIGVFVVGRGGDQRSASTPAPAGGPAARSGPAIRTVPAAIDAGLAALVDPLPGQGRAVVEAVPATAGAFAGRVINWSTGDGVAGAELTFSAGGEVMTVITGADGGFELAPPRVATYALASALA